MSLTIDELSRRADFILRGRSAFRLHGDGVVDGLESAIERRPCRIDWFINFDENYKHAFVMTPSFGEECPSALQNNSLIEHLNELLSGIEIRFSNVNPLVRDPGSLANCVFTSKIYIFTDVLQRPRDFIREAFKQHQLEAVIIDNERWRCSGERPNPTRLSVTTTATSRSSAIRSMSSSRMPLKIFYDKYSIRIGDDLVDKIERGLAECRFAIILVSNAFLENKAGSHEMRALIYRQIAEGRRKLILPIWSDVSSEEVRSRSPMVAKIAARRFRDGVEELAREINAVITSER